MTRIVLPQMSKRKSGAIINLSSSAGELPTPQMTVYAATKVNFLVLLKKTSNFRHALQTLGLSRRNTGYWSHSVQGWFQGFCPEWLWMWGASLLNDQIRYKVLRGRKH
ncbi:PREDICTED: inactive hydroxysteroid dehydrogenase-like protein 1 [Acropora digitifera]|uniref:inactive hydroxysteroid dehydrogenase-like protein 1 n=1 Tax=Acropora digitifera TaxID=70779 RepID=UPI00077A1503|nr:PREDICTED: inactive hydroxysteroid dehydrogenase-like protein 1 [Acropora digitifera]